MQTRQLSYMPRSCPVCFKSGPRCLCGASPLPLTVEQYRKHCDDLDGYCAYCGAVTAWGDVEQDTEERECPQCDALALYGVEQALLYEFIEIVETVRRHT